MHRLLRNMLLTGIIFGAQAATFTTLFDQGIQAYNQQAFHEAADYFQQALQLKPQQPELLFNLASTYRQIDNTSASLDLLEQLITLKPDYTKAYHLLIELYKQQKKTEPLQGVYTQVKKYIHDESSPYLSCARYFKDVESYNDSIDAYNQALSINKNLQVYFELANVHICIGQTEQARELYETILHHHPNNIGVIYNMGYAYKMEGNAQKAITYYKKALSLDDSHDAAHFALGMAYLVQGDFERGWQQHARYLKQVNRNADRLRQFLADNTTVGKRILLRPEGGLGDSIHFIRYARELKKYGMYVIVAVPKPLYDLFKTCDYIDELIKIGDPIPSFDDHTTLMSIPAILYSHEHALPQYEPYLHPQPERVAYWRDYLAQDTKFKIGICWEASVANDASRPPVARRGIPLEKLHILSELENVSLYSLQQHDGVEQLESKPSNFNIHVFDQTFDKTHGSFIDTVAVMEHMDLIITVDTAIAHLAGALGRPVWLLLPWATDWRWLEHRTDSPWYPTMQIFKQPEPFDWQTVAFDIYWRLLAMTSS